MLSILPIDSEGASASNGLMFVVDCPGHQARTLLSLSAITGIDQHDGIIDVHLRCWCGHALVHRTGRNADAGREAIGV